MAKPAKMKWRKTQFDDHQPGDPVWWVLSHGEWGTPNEAIASAEPGLCVATGKKGWFVWVMYDGECEEVCWSPSVPLAKQAAQRALRNHYKAMLDSVPVPE